MSQTPPKPGINLEKLQELTDFKANPLKVTNVGSAISGAGSGDFHQYRKAKRRENARLAAMEREEEEKKELEAWERAREERKLEEQRATEKRAAKRKRQKEHQRMVKQANKNTV